MQQFLLQTTMWVVCNYYKVRDRTNTSSEHRPEPGTVEWRRVLDLQHKTFICRILFFHELK